MKTLIVLLAGLSCAVSTQTTVTSLEIAPDARVVQPRAFICRSVGIFVNPADSTCTSYYKCKLGLNGALKAIYFTCPFNLFYSSMYKRCVQAFLSDCLRPSTTTTTTTLAPPLPPAAFTCVEEGRFIPHNDVTCKNYFNCVLGINGAFNVGLYTCPGSTYFHCARQRCVQAHESDCLTTFPSCGLAGPPVPSPPVPAAPTSPPVSDLPPPGIPGPAKLMRYADPTFYCTKEGNFMDDRDASCSTYFKCTLGTNGAFNVGHYSCPGSTYLHCARQRCVQAHDSDCLTDPNACGRNTTSTTTTTSTSSNATPTPGIPQQWRRKRSADNSEEDPKENFKCTKEGRFKDELDTSCTYYYLCVIGDNGKFNRGHYKCPKDTSFSRRYSRCVSADKSDCEVLTTTTQLTSTTTQAPEFACEKEGRFKDEQDLSCKWYYLCEYGKYGKLEKSHKKCPGATLFHSSRRKCIGIGAADCVPGTSVVTTAMPSSPTNWPSANLPSNAPNVEINSSAAPSPSTTTTQIPEFVCTQEGRFKDEQDSSCKLYYLCVLSEEGVMQKGHYSCPGTTLFSSGYRRCMDASTSNCVPVTTSTETPTTTTTTVIPTDPPVTITSTAASTTSAPTSAPTTTHPSNASTTTNVPEEFVCTEEGRFKDYKDTTCKMYYLCVIGDNDDFNLGHYSCPGTTLFSDRYRRCVDAGTSECEPIITTTENPETETPSTVTPTTSPPEFVCKREGRFKDEQDQTCKWYYLCVLSEAGVMQKGHYSCPGSTLFSSSYRRCVDASTSNCVPVTSTTEQPTTSRPTTNAPTDTPSTTTSSETSTTEEPTTVVTEQPTTSVQTEATSTSSSTDASTTADPTTVAATDAPTSTSSTSPPQFVCTSQGRFKDEYDDSCKKYYLCVIGDNNEFNLGHYSCPGTTLFSKKYRRCVDAGTSECVPAGTTTEMPETETPSTIPPTTQPAEFVCTSEGRFKDEQDQTCKWYYLCVLSEAGVMQKGHYSCPGTTLFSSSYRRCVDASTSNCVPVTSTTEQPTTSRPTTNAPTDTPPTTTSNETSTTEESTTVVTEQPTTSAQTEATSTSSSTEASTTAQSTTVSPTVSSTDAPTSASTTNEPSFVCSSEGRFKDEHDESCKMYYLCVIGNNGEFNLGHYSCPGTTLFSKKYRRCVDADTSECVPVTTTSESPTSSIETQPTTTTDAPTTATPEFVCTSEGRFKDEQDLTCKWYYLCVLSAQGVMQKGHYSCPGTTLFNSQYRRCMEASMSQCVPVTSSTQAPTTSKPTEMPTDGPATEITTHEPTSATTIGSTTEVPTSSASTTSESTTEAPTTAAPTNSPTTSGPEFVCSQEGRFKDEQDSTCKMYYLCVIGDNGEFNLGHYSCPGGTLFSDRYRRCVDASSSECVPVTTTTDTSTETSEPTKPTTSTESTETAPTQTTDAPSTAPPEFVCKSEGRFKDEQDLTCKWYYLCVRDDVGNMQKGHYECPGTTLFNKNYRRCMDAASSDCTPVNGNTTLAPPTTVQTSTNEPTDLPTTTTRPEPDCVIPGSFPDPNLPHCGGYYKCVQVAGGLVKVKHVCPAGTLYHLQLKYCVPETTYECPV